MINYTVILGSTGSIGRQSAAVCERLGIRVPALAANRSVELLLKQVETFAPEYVSAAEPEANRRLREALSGRDITVGPPGEEGLRIAAAWPGADCVVTAVSGAIGLRPTLDAIETGRRIALANKETLVCAGGIVMRAARERGAEIVPVDSEHSAIFQCLTGRRGELKKILLTGSGGPFRGWTREQTASVTPEQAVKHPNWSMGAKISVDSATMMNKGLEFIEAMHLFGVRPEDIEVLIHPESVVHSAVELVDGTVIAQLGVPDMRIPIQYALTWPDRLPSPAPELDFAALKHLSFDVADEETFRCLAACKKAIRKGGLAPCAANGANEEAVRLFLQDKIGFLDIGRLVEGVVDSEAFGGDYTLQDVWDCDAMSRAYVRAHL